ncbi:MAG: hypothetical protein QUS08_00700 [Methanothrix sp.]|nr:hypothetical protein [Methanothrix sp.]
MEIELHPAVTLRPGSFTALIAPREVFISALNRNLNLQRFSVLYITGNRSAILSGLDRRFEDLHVRRGFTAFQLMTILEESHHSLIMVEHDPLLYEDAEEMAEYVSQAMRHAAERASVLLYSPSPDPRLEELVRSADRVIHLDEGPRMRASQREDRSQTTLEAFT